MTEQAKEDHIAAAGDGSQQKPRVQLAEAIGNGVESLSDNIRRILVPVMQKDTPEPDIMKITLELVSRDAFVKLCLPVPGDVTELYGDSSTGQPLKLIFPAYLRLVAEKWEEIMKEGEN